VGAGIGRLTSEYESQPQHVCQLSFSTVPMLISQALDDEGGHTWQNRLFQDADDLVQGQ
jgi:hypothetical protein